MTFFKAIFFMSNLLTLTLFYTRMFSILYNQGKRSTEEDEKDDWEKLLWKAEKQVHLTTKHECKVLQNTPDYRPDIPLTTWETMRGMNVNLNVNFLYQHLPCTNNDKSFTSHSTSLLLFPTTDRHEKSVFSIGRCVHANVMTLFAISTSTLQ